MAGPVRFSVDSKYHARRTTMDGIVFASQREADRYQDLRMLERAGEIAGLRCQVPYRLEVNGVKIGRYVADFCYEEHDVDRWLPITEDCKGVRTPVYRLKAKLMLALHGVKVRET